MSAELKNHRIAVYGLAPGEMLQDEEGIQTIRKNTRAMAWLLKVVESGKEKYPFPQEEANFYTNFTR